MCWKLYISTTEARHTAPFHIDDKPGPKPSQAQHAQPKHRAHHVQRQQVVLMRVRKARLRQLRPARERLAPLVGGVRRVGQLLHQRLVKRLRNKQRLL
jgi:hypothetical protein